MVMRKEYRPFNVEQAKAGAPYGVLHDSYDVKILYMEDGVIIGMERWTGVEGEWNAAQWAWDGLGESLTQSKDLVMLPLFHLQSKPVYMGDTLYDANGQPFQVELSHTQSMIDGCSWEVLRAKIETSLTESDCDLIAGRAHYGTEGVSIANAAIARAIKDGDVVPKDKVKEIIEFVQRLDVAGPDVAWVHVEAGFF